MRSSHLVRVDVDHDLGGAWGKPCAVKPDGGYRHSRCQAEQQVGILNGKVGTTLAGRSEASHEAGVILTKQVHGADGGHDRDTQPPNEFAELCLRAGEVDAVAA